MGCTNNEQILDAKKRSIHEMMIGQKMQDIYNYYQYCKTIGQGSFGKVFLMIHKETGVKRAVKQISKSKMTSIQIKQLYQQFKILKQLNHPHIVKLYGLYDTKQSIFIVTQMLQGGQLLQYIIKNKKLKQSISSHIMKNILQAVNYCHKKGIVHRDIKPQNLLLTQKDNINNIKLVDFGCSTTKHQCLHQLIGTPIYLAPQVIKQKYNEKCDIWSCGVILYIFFTGRPPFFGSNLEQIKTSIIAGGFDQNSMQKIGINQLGIDLVKKMLTYDYEKRPSAQQCLQHKWFQRFLKRQEIDKNILRISLQNISHFYRRNKLVKVISMLMFQKYSIQQTANLQKIFKILDKNNDGVISRQQLQQAVTQNEISSDMLFLLKKSLSQSDQKTINYSDFILAASNKRKYLYGQRIDQTFRFIDTDNSGKIELNQLKQVMGGVKAKQIQQLIKKVDANKDGQISLQQWRNMFI